MQSHFEVEIDRNGAWVTPAQVDQILSHLTGSPPDAVFVMSHGWNNSIDDARTLYRNFFALLPQTGQSLTTIGILWPSMKFVDPSEIPGGAAALGGSGAPHTFVEELLETLGPQPIDEEGAHELFSISPDELFQLAWQPIPAASDSFDAGGAASLESFASGAFSAVRNLLNTTTYYQMKARAGLVGQNGVTELLDRMEASSGLPVHLIGHSFGARVVTSAASRTQKKIASLTLLQAAFSQNSFSPDYDSSHSPGCFRDVIHPGTVRGPILVSHSFRDLAVGLAYAIASRIARQNASAIGDASDPYGGLGRNGAQNTPEAIDGELEADSYRYSFSPGVIYNLRADDIIHSHGDIVHPQIANALLQAAKLS